MKATNLFELGSKDSFTGVVLLLDFIGASKEGRIKQVIFTPGARTHWHTHRISQTIIITVGKAWIGIKEDGVVSRKELSQGESFHFKPYQEHWHGAAPDSLMEHIAITQGETDWKDPVNEAEYFPAHEDDIQSVMTNLTFAFAEAEKNAYLEFFKNHLSKDLIFRQANERIANKNSFIEDLKKLRYEYNIPGNIQVFPAADNLSAAVSLTVSAKIIGKSIIEGQWKNIRLFKYSEGRWQLTGWYNEPA